MTVVYHKPKACQKCGCSQDLPAGLQSCRCTCHPANWPPDAAPLLYAALKLCFARLQHKADTCRNSAWKCSDQQAYEAAAAAIAKAEDA